MPRVSDEHLAARRQQILDAARRCFLRNGFHASSMHDVVAETGLSVGAVYRYFKSKNEIVGAIAAAVVGGVTAALQTIADQDPPVPLSETMDQAINLIDAQLGPEGAFRLALQVWAEAMRDPALGEMISERYAEARAHFVRIAAKARDRGELPPDTDLDAVGAVLFGLMPGYGLQRLLTGYPDKKTYLSGLHALLQPKARVTTVELSAPQAGNHVHDR